MASLTRLRPAGPLRSLLSPQVQLREFRVSAVALGSASGKKGSSGGGAKKATGKISKKKYEPPPVRRIEPHAVLKIDHDLTSARASDDLPIFAPAELTEAVVGSSMAFPADKTSPNHIFGLPKNLQEDFLHTPKPFSIIRKSTLELLGQLDGLSALDGSPQRLVLTGPAGCGKSVLLLQAANYCALNEWIVYYAPRAVEWVDASSEYSFDYRSRVFHQYNLAATALNRILQASHGKLGKIKLNKDIPLPGGKTGAVLKAGTPLEALVSVGTKDPALAPQTLTLLLEALGEQTQYPVLIAIDDIQALYNTSHYRDPQFKLLSSYHLSMPRLILEYASGQRKLARGAVLGAVSLSDHRFPLRLELHEALGLGWEGGQEPDPYEKRSKSLQTYATGLRSVPVPPRFTPSEAAALVESWFRGRLLHSGLNDSFFHSKYAESNGNPRELLNRGIMNTMTI
ncbi:37S ribosomal protein S23 mitochondrial [Tulasnella sp. JGI-2019a]|nr:37S ribosomal protein S23 mitochondrial [Tulasnella sp. JGI-2019a]KAG9018315.1 37S ribosomal protein S23 mitochondrial [Tulasnella sp. JGI-2019a]KAG9030034.1 37S ribosomal protein S23 mitochondrial [Tulasnella sp. JGI-2019a]